MTDDDVKRTVLACIACAVLCLGTLWLTVARMGSMQAAQTEQTELIRQVLKRIPGMTTFAQDVTNQAGHVIHVSVTCREAENLETCFARFTAAVAVAAASNT